MLALLFPLAAFAEADVYGKLMLGIEHIDDETDASDYWDVKSYASRFGIKGDFDTDTKSLKVIYQLEWEVDVTDEGASSNDHLKSRNQYLGLEGDFGQFIVGRMDTPFKRSQGKLDLFNDILDIKLLMAGGENRESNIFQYTSPKIADVVTISFLGRPGEDPNGDNNGLADAFSTSAAYNNDSLYVALAYDSEIDGDNVTAVRVVATWKVTNEWGVGGLVQNTDWDTGNNEDVLLANAYYKYGKATFKAQLGHTENYEGIESNLAGDDNTADYLALGVDYSLGKQTTVGAYLGNFEGGDGLDIAQFIAGGPYTRDVLGVIMIHKF